MQQRLRAVRRLDDDVGLRERVVDVAALVAARLDRRAASRATASSGSSTTSSCSHSTTIAWSAARACAERVGGDRRDGRADVARLLDERGDLARAERGAHARERERRREVDARHARVRVRRAEQRRVQHPREPDVRRVARLAAHPLERVLAHGGPADDRLRPRGPLLQRILLDDEPDLLVAALDLLLRADQPRQCRIASSIFGYVPQRQMFPAISWRISSTVGSGCRATSAAAETTWPGRAEAALHRVGADERVDERMLAQPLDRRHLALDEVRERDARERRHAVDLHGAGAAVALVARDLRAGEPEPLAQHVRQALAERRVDGVAPAR